MKLKTSRTEEWIKIERDGEIAEFLVYPINPKENTALINKFTKKGFNKGMPTEETDWYKFKVARIDAIIRDWKGIQDEDGNTLPCDARTKEIIFLNNTDLIDEVLEKADALAKFRQDEQEDLIKNLNGGPSGPPRTN